MDLDYLSMMFSEYADLWLVRTRSGYKSTTESAYVNAIEKHLKPAFCDKLINEIGEEDIQGAIDYWTLQGNRKTGKGLSPKSIKEIYGTLKRILNEFEFDTRQRKIFYDRIKLPKTKRDEVAIFENNQLKKFLKYLKNNKTPKNAGLLMGLGLGLRISEICGLKWDYIDLEQRIVSIKEIQTYTYLMGDEGRMEYNCLLGSPKTADSIREIPFDDIIYEFLEAVMPKNSSGVFLVSGKDKMIVSNTLRVYYYRVLNELELPKIKFHALRHTFASYVATKEKDCVTLSRILGHSKPSVTTDIYCHPLMEDKRKISKFVNDFILSSENLDGSDSDAK